MEGLVASTILLVVLLATIPVMNSILLVNQQAEEITSAENLAQATIERIRTLSYDNVGIQGYSPDGVLQESYVESIDGADYAVDIDITYQGSFTGLDVIPQGGDGVQGRWDPGVDYKYVLVTVTPPGRPDNPVVMETLVSPDAIGAHEDIANGKVTVILHEPYGSNGDPHPLVQLQGGGYGPFRSQTAASEQFFPGLPQATYQVSISPFSSPPGLWLVHPDDVASPPELQAIPAVLGEASLRVYQPVSVEIDPRDDVTNDPIAGAIVKLTHVPTGTEQTYPPGQYVIGDLLPDEYEVEVSAPGYTTWVENHAIAGPPAVAGAPVPDTLSLSPQMEVALFNSIPVTLFVRDNRDSWATNGANVQVAHPLIGTMTGVTNDVGEVTMLLPENSSGFVVVASTIWGHASDTDTFNTGSGPQTETLTLGRPSGHGRGILFNGDNATYGYRVEGSGAPWIELYPNDSGTATFTAPATSGFPRDYEVRRVCTGNGNEQTASLRLREDRDRSTTFSGSCP